MATAVHIRIQLAISLPWSDGVGSRVEGWVSVALGIFLVWQDLAEHGLPRKEILEQVLLSVLCRHLPSCIGIHGSPKTYLSVSSTASQLEASEPSLATSCFQC